MKKIKFAVVGCGRISYKHFEAYEEHIDDLELVAVCDTDIDRAMKYGTQYSAKVFNDYEKMLNEIKIDLIAICTPSGLHPVHGMMAAKHKIHVISEKPMATNVKDADSFIECCKENKVELFVVKQNRLNSTLKLVKRAIEKKRFGKIYFASTNVFWTRPQSYYDAADWRGTWALDGGAYMNQASHYVDMLEWLIGPVESVMAHTATLARDIEAEDTGAASLRFLNGAIGSINVTMLTYPKNLEGSLTIIGEKGTVKIGGVAVNNIEQWDFEDYDDDDKFVTESNYNPPNIYGYGHTGYYSNVVRSLRGQESASTDGNEGKKSLQLIDAIYRSAKTGEKIVISS